MTAVSQLAGLLALVGLAVARSEPLPSAADLAWGASAGLSGSLGLAALYRALAIGRMGIAAPVTAVLAAAMPVLFSAWTEGPPRPSQLIGFALALAGVWFVSRPDGQVDVRRGLGLAVFAGAAFGGLFVLIGQVGPGAVFWPLVAARGAAFLLMLAIAVAGRRPWLPDAALLPLVILAGVLDVGGNAFFVLARQAGRLDVSAVLASLYPAATVLLARLVLHERVSRLQAAGIAATLAAVPLIAAG